MDGCHGQTCLPVFRRPRTRVCYAYPCHRTDHPTRHLTRDTAPPSAATQRRFFTDSQGTLSSAVRYAPLACRAPSRGAATSCSLGREPQEPDVRNLASPGGATSYSMRGQATNATRTATSSRWGFAARADQDSGARAPGYMTLPLPGLADTGRRARRAATSPLIREEPDFWTYDSVARPLGPI